MMASVRSIFIAGVLASAAAANPLPTTTTKTKVTACTYTTHTTQRPSTSQPLTWPPVLTMTSYTSTVTANASVDCSGCYFFRVDHTIFGFPSKEGRLPTSIAIHFAPEPTTVTRTHCSGFFDDDVKPEVVTGHGYRREDTDILGVQHEPDSTASDCTARIYRAPQFNLGPTSTVWTTTSTATRTVDCGPCNHVTTTRLPVGMGPVALFKTTVTATQPTIVTTLVCGHPTQTSSDAPTSAAEGTVETKTLSSSSMTTTTIYPSYWAPPYPWSSTIFPEGIQDPECTRTIELAPDFPDSTLTVYPSTITQTSRRNCGTCAIVWSTRNVEYLVPVRYVTTVFKEKPSVATALVCSARASRDVISEEGNEMEGFEE